MRLIDRIQGVLVVKVTLYAAMAVAVAACVRLVAPAGLPPEKQTGLIVSALLGAFTATVLLSVHYHAMLILRAVTLGMAMLSQREKDTEEKISVGVKQHADGKEQVSVHA